jgi:hypothetical protein
MAKADFEFYEIPPIAGEFVLPAYGGDPYKGLFHPRDAGMLALSTLAEVVKEVTGEQPHLTTKRAELGSTNDDHFFQKCMPADSGVIREHATLSFPLPDERGVHVSETMGELAQYLTRSHDRANLISKGEQHEHGVSDPPTVRREAIGQSATLLLDEQDRPVNPRLTSLVRQLTPVRAYRWLPGPDRISYRGLGRLAPTYSPRPVNVAFAQTIEVVGLNPRAKQV